MIFLKRYSEKRASKTKSKEIQTQTNYSKTVETKGKEKFFSAMGMKKRQLI